MRGYGFPLNEINFVALKKSVSSKGIDCRYCNNLSELQELTNYQVPELLTEYLTENIERDGVEFINFPYNGKDVLISEVTLPEDAKNEEFDNIYNEICYLLGISSKRMWKSYRYDA